MHALWLTLHSGPLIAAAGIILLSFVSEDAATFSSALLTLGGPIDWRLGFLACFTGIWFGDIGLYFGARCMGASLLHARWLGNLVSPDAIDRARHVMERRGSVALIACRFLPGTRLPTYLAAGFFSLPWRRFALLTGAGAFVWIAVAFLATRTLGNHAITWFGAVQSRTVPVVTTALVVLGAFACVRKFPLRRIMTRIRQWEFWPAWIFYLPIAIYYILLGIRYRSLSLPTAANPGMESSGFVGESKREILEQLHRGAPESVAKAFPLHGSTVTDRLLALHRTCREEGVELPFILKPDLGQRGNGVRLIRAWREALDYLQQCSAPVILQRYASGQHEAGIFYYRVPGEQHGQIFSITEKIFPRITGDGIHTLEELVRADARAAMMAHVYLKRFANRRNEILGLGETLKLVESGNHAQGCIFQEGGHLWTEELEAAIDRISRSFPGFYIGRYDLRYDDESALRAGHGFEIVELNGASAEATNVYDVRTSLLRAYRILFRQWKLVFEIGAANRSVGSAPISLLNFWKEWRRYASASLSYPIAS